MRVQSVRGTRPIITTVIVAISVVGLAQPSARGYVDMVYVPQVGKVLLFGGQAIPTPPYTMVGETWWYDPAAQTWERVTSEPQPSPRGAGNLEVHTPTGTVVMFGGGVAQDGGFHSYSETWLFDPSEERWSLLEPVDGVGPEASIGEMLAYHPPSDLFVLHGGLTLSPFAFLDHTWHLDLAAERWTRAEPQTRPTGRNYNAFDYDPRNERLVMSGGGPEIDDELWHYDPRTVTWSFVERDGVMAAQPYPRMVFDDATGTLLRYGGLGEHADTVWAIDATGAAWNPLAVVGDTPGGISRFAMTALPGHGLLVFGGMYDGGSEFHGDLWLLDPAAGRWERR